MSPLPAFLVFGLGAAGTIVLWSGVEARAEAEARRAAVEAAGEVSQQVEQRVALQLEGLRQLAKNWERLGVSSPVAWRAQVELLMKQQKGLLLVALLASAPSPAPDAQVAPGTQAAPGTEAVPPDRVAPDDAKPAPAEPAVPTTVAVETQPAVPETPEPAIASVATPPAAAPGTGTAEEPPAALHVRAIPDANGELQRLIAADPAVLEIFKRIATEGALIEAAATSLAGDDQSLAGPFTVPGGPPLYAMTLPLKQGEAPAALLALVSPAALMEGALLGMASGFRVRVSDGSHLLYRRPGSPAADLARARGAGPPAGPGEAPVEWMRVDRPIRPALGVPWSLEVAREERVMPGAELGGPRSVLGTGMVISILAAGLVHLAQLTRVRARAVEHSNRELMANIQQARHAEHELRVLNRTLEQRVEERTEELKETVADLETFSYSVSHDLRSPLGAIVNFTSVLDEDYGSRLDDEGRLIVNRITRSARSALSMMEGLLSFSRIGRQELLRTPVDMRPVVAGALAELVAGGAPQAARVRVGTLVPAYADAAMMRIVWTNLLSNALKYTKGSPAPRVEVGSKETDDETVFFVRDNGMGFDPREAERIFGVFVRLHPEHESGGHGVGLAVVKRIVARHGGRVWARSTPGKGAVFCFALPKSGRAPPSSPPSPAVPPAPEDDL